MGFSGGHTHMLKSVCKAIANAMVILTVVVPVLCYRFACVFFGQLRAFPGWSQLFSLVPGMFGDYLRRAFYRLVLPGCGHDACISFGTVFSHPTAEIGNR